MKVIVAGGGIIGCSIAYHLRKAGAGVVLIERGEIAREASGAAAGLLIPPAAAVAPGPFRDICFASVKSYRELIARVQHESGVDAQCVASGILVLAESEGSVRALKAHVEAERRHGRNTEWIDRQALRSLEPALSPHVLGAAFSPDEVHVSPGAMTLAFARAAERLGAEIRTGTFLTGFARSGRRLRGVSTNLGEFAGDAVVLAAGPWTQALALRLGTRIPVPPMRGQMITYRSEAVSHAIWGDAGYLVPKTGGILYAGATVEDVGFRKTATARGIGGLRRMAGDLVPSLRGAEPAGAWAGLRPGTPDGLPTIGRPPGWENLYVATGHFRNGILLAPVTGRLITALVLGEKPEIPVEPYDPARFGRS